MVDGRKAPGSMYYVGRGKDGLRTCSKPHNAALMTEALAKLLVTKLTGHHAEVCELLCDETSTIHDSLVDIGENLDCYQCSRTNFGPQVDNLRANKLRGD